MGSKKNGPKEKAGSAKTPKAAGKSPKDNTPKGQNLIEHTNLQEITTKDVKYTYRHSVKEFQNIRDFQDLHKAMINSCLLCCLCCIFVPVIPICMVVIGIIGVSNGCPVQPFIPYWLILTGILQYTFALLSWSYKSKTPPQIQQEQLQKPIDVVRKAKPGELWWIFDCLFHTFLFFWFFAGCICAFQAFNKYQDEDQNGADYCQSVVILFAFWYCLFMFTLMIVLIIGLCVLVAFASGIEVANEANDSGDKVKVEIKPVVVI